MVGYPPPLRHSASQSPGCSYEGRHGDGCSRRRRPGRRSRSDAVLLGFAGALRRRSELVALDVEDVSEDDGGLRLISRKSKTDQEAEGTVRGLPYGSHPATCPVRAWRRWLAVSGIDTGPGVPIRRSSRPPGSQAPQRPGGGRHDQAPRTGRRPRRRLRRSLPSRRLRHRGLRPGHARAGHHAPRPLAIGVGDAGPPAHTRGAKWGQASPESATRLRRSKSCPRSGAYRTLRPITPLSTGLTPSKVRLTTSGFGVSATAQTPAGAMLAW